MDNQNWLGRLFGRKSQQRATPQFPTPQHSVPHSLLTDQGTNAIGDHASTQMTSRGQPAPPVATPSLRGTEAGVPAVWKIGDVLLDQYEVTGILGEGGMGMVYRVHHRGWNIDLAVKSPKPEIFARAGGKENFIHEAETWVNLRLHPYIVSCYYVRTLGSIPRVFAEYVTGGSLADWIRNRRLYAGGHQQALTRILDIAIQFAWGLHDAHEQGLVHQDVKPANVMMTPEGIAKVTDFGLAKARAMASESSGDAGSWQQSILVSSRGMTPAYCSPEQAAGQPLSRKTDIWSWGVSVLEMFVGDVTWMAGALAREALASHQALAPVIPAMPSDMVNLLARCFQPQPEDRPTTMLGVATELQAMGGQPYPRQAPKPAEMLANSLNNQGLSLYDLGRVDDAKQRWEQGLQVDPQHLETTYNRGVVLWRRGELVDDVLVHQLQSIQARQSEGWQVRYLLAQVHLERGEVDAAHSLLQEGIQLAPGETEIQALLRRVQSGDIPTSRCLRTFQGHRGKVYSVSLSADGRYALSAGEDETVRLWEMSTGRCLRTFQGHTGGVYSVSLSADGGYALSGSEDETVRLWEVSTGRCLRSLQGNREGVYSVSLSADGRYALSAGNSDPTVRLWEVSTGRCLRTWEERTDVLASSVSLSADGKYALSGGEDDTLRLWDMSTGRCLRIFQGHMWWVSSVRLSADGRHALSGSWDKTVRLWEVSTGRCLRTFQGHTEGVDSVSLSADGRYALSASEDKTVRMWEVSTGRCLRTFQGHTGPVKSVSLSADGRYALSASEDHTLRLWELPRQEVFCRLHPCKMQSHAETSHMETQVGVWLEQAKQAWKEERFTLALHFLQQVRGLPGWERVPKSLDAWSELVPYCSRIGLRTGWLAKTFRGHTMPMYTVSLSADGRYALSGSHDYTLRMWEVSTGRCLRTFQGHTMVVSSVNLSTDGRYILSGSWDRTMRMWEVSTGCCLRTFQDTGEYTASLSADGRYALSGGEDKTLRLWEVSTGRCLRVFQGHTSWVYTASLSADGRYALSGSEDKTLRLWEVSTGRYLRTFRGHTNAVKSVSLSMDGRYALSGSEDKTLRLWEVSTGRCLRTFQGHRGPVNSVNLSVDGRYALSASDDLALRLWEVSTGRCLRTFQGDTGGVRSVSLSADGRYALLGGEDETVRLWEFDWELEAHDPTDWDEGARPFLQIFLTQHTPYAGTLPSDREPSEEEIQLALTRSGKATWTKEDFQGLLRQLQCAGSGWLRPEGVLRKLEEMAQYWQGLPPLPGQCEW